MNEKLNGVGESRNSENSESSWDELSEVEFAGDKEDIPESNSSETNLDATLDINVDELFDSPDRYEEAEVEYSPDDLRRRMFTTAAESLGRKNIEESDPLVSVESYLERQSPECQSEIMADQEMLKELRQEYRRNLMIGNSGAPNNYFKQKQDIIRRHFDDPDCISYLMAAASEPVEVAVADMLATDAGRATGHFAELSQILEPKFGKNAGQAAFDILQMGLNNIELSGGNGDFSPVTIADTDRLIDLAEQKDLGIDHSFLHMYLRQAGSSPDIKDQEAVANRLEIMAKNDVSPSEVLSAMIDRENFAAAVNQSAVFAQYRLDAKATIDKRIQEILDSPASVAEHLIDNPQPYQEYGIDVRWVLRNNLPKIWEISGDHLSYNAEKIAELGVDLDQIAADSASLSREKEVGLVSGFSKEAMFVSELPPEVKKEWQESVENYKEREDSARTRELLAKLRPENWGNVDRSERERILNEYLEVLVGNYNIKHPVHVRIVSENELLSYDEKAKAKEAGLSRVGQCHSGLILADSPEAEDFTAKVREVGIGAPWILCSEVRLNEETLNDGEMVADFLAHEMRHAFQEEQSFLYRHGYYNQENPGGDFEHLPHLAQYFTANMQREYHSQSLDSYDDYRNQLIEADAFYFGQYYQDLLNDKTQGNGVTRLEKLPEPKQLREAPGQGARSTQLEKLPEPEHQSLRKKLTSKIKNWWNKRSKKGVKNGK